jgi:hypothetical protein
MHRNLPALHFAQVVAPRKAATFSYTTKVIAADGTTRSKLVGSPLKSPLTPSPCHCSQKSHLEHTMRHLSTNTTQTHRDSHNHSHSHTHTHTHDLQIHTTTYTDFSYFDTHLKHISSILLAFERSQNFLLIISFSPLLVSVCILNSEIQTFTSLFVPGLF